MTAAQVLERYQVLVPPPSAAEAYGGDEESSIPTDTIDIYRTFDSSNGRTRVQEVEMLSGGTKVTNITSATVYQYTDGTNPSSGATAGDWGTHSVLTNGYKTNGESSAVGFTIGADKRLNYFEGGVSPKLLYRFVVPSSENVDGVASYYDDSEYLPGIKIEKNSVLVYNNSAVPISGHQETYSGGGDTSKKIQSNFGTVIPNTFGSPTTTYTTNTGDQVISAGSAYYRQTSVFRMKGSIIQGTTNTLFEFGGSGRGMACYMYGGTLYVQCGDGSVSGGQLEFSYAVAASETITDVTLSLSTSQVNSGTCSLFVNLIKVATGTYSGNADVFGQNAGGIRQKHSSMCTTRMGSGTGNSYILADGSVTSLDVWGGSYLNNS
jgi:hypothetical protein